MKSHSRYENTNVFQTILTGYVGNLLLISGRLDLNVHFYTPNLSMLPNMQIEFTVEC